MPSNHIPQGLSQGDSGPDVMNLFMHLWDTGWLSLGLSAQLMGDRYAPAGLTAEQKSAYDNLLTVALMRFQVAFGLKPTGTVTEETAGLINSGRCGRADIHKETPASFTAGPGPLGPQAGFEYIETQAAMISYPMATDIFTRTFNQWGMQLGTHWSVGGQPLLAHTSFQTGSHGDGYPFDGPEGILAHAWSLVDEEVALRGTLHLDGDERWGSEFDIETIALHEAGHIHGLEHSFDRGSVMFPYAKGTRRAVTDLDRHALLALYGR